MATQLNPGADPTLVQAAYAAGMANVPQDYSKAFAAMAEGYEKGTKGIEAAIKPLVKDAFAGVAEGAQKLLRDAGGAAWSEVEGAIGGLLFPYKKDKADNPLDIPGYTEQEQTFVDSDLFSSVNLGKLEDSNLDKMSEDEVGKLQEQLLAAGYKLPKFGADKKMGPETKKAVEQAREDTKKLQGTATYAQSQIDKFGKYATQTNSMDDVEVGIDEGNKEYVLFGEYDENEDEITVDLTTKEGQKKAREYAKEVDDVKSEYWKGQTQEWEVKLAERTKVLKSGATFTDVNENGQSTEVFVGDIDSYIPALRAQLKQAQDDNNNDEVRRLETILENVTDSTRAFDKAAVTVRSQIKNNLLNTDAMGGQAIDFVRALGQNGRSISGTGEVDGSSVILGFDAEGQQVYIWVDKYNRPIINKEDGQPFVVRGTGVKDYVVQKDAGAEVDTGTVTQADQIAAGKSGIAFNGQEYVNNMTKVVKDENTFKHLTNTLLLDKTETWREAVWGVGKDDAGNVIMKPGPVQTAIFAELHKQGGFDNNGDGSITTADFMTIENYTAAANYLTSYNPTSTRAFANWMKSSAQGYHTQGAKTRKTGGGGGAGGVKPLSGGTYYQIGWDAEANEAITTMGRNITNNFAKFVERKEFKSYDEQYTFKFDENKGWSITGPSEETDKIATKYLSQSEVADMMKFEEYRDELGVKKGSKWGSAYYDQESGKLLGSRPTEQQIIEQKKAEQNPFKGEGGAVVPATEHMATLWGQDGDINGTQMKKHLEEIFPDSPFVYTTRNEGQDLTISIPGTEISKEWQSDPGVFVSDKKEVQRMLKWLAQNWETWKKAELEELNPNK